MESFVFVPSDLEAGKLLGSKRAFKQYGQSGAWVCEKYPNVAKHVDDFAFIKSLYSESNDHVPALYQINTGIARPGFPSAGAWITYGLGSESQNLPGYVVLGNNQGVKGGPLNWSAGFLPATYQGTLFRNDETPIFYLLPPDTVSSEQQRSKLDFLADLNRSFAADKPEDTELEARANSYELAYRMQAAAPEAIDFSKESDLTKRLYGLEDPITAKFGANCLLARRLVDPLRRKVATFGLHLHTLDIRQHARVHARAVVRDGQLHPAVCLPHRRHHRRAFRGVGAGVGEQVEQNLLRFFPIAADARTGIAHHTNEGDALQCELGRHHCFH